MPHKVCDVITPALEELTPAVAWVLVRRAEEGGGTRQDGGEGWKKGGGLERNPQGQVSGRGKASCWSS